MPKIRLDNLLVERGLATSREQAKRLILAGKVTVEGVENPKPGGVVSALSRVRLAEREKFVSRGGLKLEAALRDFAIAPRGLVCVDVGASTGGFTDCLLQNGAAKVFAVDVGATQLHEKLRGDPRVIVMDHTNARDLGPASFPESISLVVMDVSFISAKIILPALSATFVPGTRLVLLIKPQFEAGRVEVSRGKGIIRDPEIHRRIIADLIDQARFTRWGVRGLAKSPIQGGSGNSEFLAAFERLSDKSGGNDESGMIIDIDALVAINSA